MVPTTAVSLLEPLVASAKRIRTDKRPGDTSAVAGTEMLASASTHPKDVAAVPPASAGENSQRAVRPMASSASDKLKGRAVSPDKECENGENAIEVNSNIEDSSMDVAAAPVFPDDAANDTCQQHGFGSDAHLGAEIALEDQRDIIRDLSASVPPSRCQAFKDGMKQGIISPSDIDVTFENFPYYLSENTKNVLLSCAFIHLEKKEFIKQFAEISSINQRILLSGPAGSEKFAIFQKHHRSSLADAVHFRRPAAPTSSVNADIVGTSTLHSASLPKQESSTATSKSYTFREGDRVRYVGPAQPPSLPQAELLRPDFATGEEVERLAMTELIEAHPGGFLFTSLPVAVRHFFDLFPDEALLTDWKQQLDRDVETLKAKSNVGSIRSFLNRNGIECNDLEELFIKDQSLSNESTLSLCIPKLSGDSQVSYRVLSSKLLSVTQDVVTENEFEKRLLVDVIPPNDIGVTFDDIGALENVKDTLKELVMLPLQRPELFCKGQLTKVI
ncbi:hypothetical protein HU200_049138 [Digitaria exilis]|uniref:Uncharacterized protein n=1 Tax=Digitaria exilis TaxID=1010633 RepID=A0A835ECC6_9POAL|nr:hypothetical protein HU200_049138 [Digitaria exilis]